jgi:hypothetical protein
VGNKEKIEHMRMKKEESLEKRGRFEKVTFMLNVSRMFWTRRKKAGHVRVME